MTVAREDVSNSVHFFVMQFKCVEMLTPPSVIPPEFFIDSERC